MKLYLVQHAKAASEEDDPQRGLTEEGRGETERIAAFIKPLNLQVEYLWHSGKKRAEQTAQILSEAVNAKTLTVQDGLGPNDDVKAFEEKIVSSEADMMIVGHMPFLGKLASLLLTSLESARMIRFKNSGIVCLNYSDDNQWQFDWAITAEIIT
jgi:phosphohistidine phosphatase